MRRVSIAIPDEQDLLQPVPIAQYGDAVHRARGGARHLSALLPALSAAIGSPTSTRVHSDPEALCATLGLPKVRSAIVVLVDGLGYWNLNMRIGHAPYLRSLMKRAENARPIASTFPSTTVAALAAFGTGTAPGLTGMTGYTQRNPGTGALAQLIQFDGAPDPLDLQREPTIFERLREQGVRATSAGLRQFADSPLTRAALRGADYVSGGTPNARVAAACRAAREPGLTYFYLRDVDKTGHHDGWEGESWAAALESVDAQLGLLHRSAPEGTLIVITADHGMITPDPSCIIDVAARSDLRRDVALVGGEARAAMLYVKPEADVDEVAQRWRESLHGQAQVRTRAEAVKEGLFGPVSARVEPMIGDIVVSALGRTTIVDSRTQSENAMHLAGVHGSMSAMEADIPLLIDLID